MTGESKKSNCSTSLPIRDGADCPISWKELPGKGRIRWSEHCGHFLYNPEQLTDEDLTALVLFREVERPNCLYKRADGLIQAHKCKNGAEARPFRPDKIAIAAMFIVLIVTFLSRLDSAPASKVQAMQSAAAMSPPACVEKKTEVATADTSTLAAQPAQTEGSLLDEDPDPDMVQPGNHFYVPKVEIRHE